MSRHRRGIAALGPTWMFRLGLVALVGITLGLLTLSASSVRADYQSGHPDENTSQAFGPLQGAHTYSATLNNDGSNPNDQDWYYFYVPAAGDQLHFTIKNTSAKCTPRPQAYYCHVYAWLAGSDGQQLGGSSSTAGTSGALPGQTQYIDWKFSSPGTYYLAFVGDGDTSNYQFNVTPASGVSSPPLHLTAHQSGRYIDISLVLPSPTSRLTASLYMGTGSSRRLAGRLSRTDLPKGKFHGAIRLNSLAWSRLKQRHSLTLHLQVAITQKNGNVLRASRKLVAKYP